MARRKAFRKDEVENVSRHVRACNPSLLALALLEVLVRNGWNPEDMCMTGRVLIDEAAKLRERQL